MKVKVYVINENQPGQYYGLKDAADNTVLRFCPNNWKTRKGAIRWANNNGCEVVE